MEERANRLYEFLLAIERNEPGCWLWRGSKTARGYGRISYQGKMVGTHLLAYRLMKGEIPPDVLFRHTCGESACFNPAHLQETTRKEMAKDPAHVSNKFRQKTHCLRGHPYSGENLLVSSGARFCRACMREHCKKYYAKKAQERRHGNHNVISD